MTVAELIDLSNRMTYKGRRCTRVYTFNPRAGLGPCPEGYIYVGTSVRVIGVEDDKPGTIESGGLVSIKDLEQDNESSWISTIKHTIILLEMHEVEETIAVDGKRIFDPHNLSILRLPYELEEAA